MDMQSIKPVDLDGHKTRYVKEYLERMYQKEGLEFVKVAAYAEFYDETQISMSRDWFRRVRDAFVRQKMVSEQESQDQIEEQAQLAIANPAPQAAIAESSVEPPSRKHDEVLEHLRLRAVPEASEPPPPPAPPPDLRVKLIELKALLIEISQMLVSTVTKRLMPNRR